MTSVPHGLHTGGIWKRPAVGTCGSKAWVHISMWAYLVTPQTPEAQALKYS